MNILYTTTAVSYGGRDGKVEVLNTPLKYDMTVPAEMGGSGKPGFNPEQLFAAAYASCFEGTVNFIAHKKKIKLLTSSTTAEVGAAADEIGGFLLKVSLTLRVSGVDQATADALMQETHKLCAYSKATKGNIPVSSVAIVE